MNAQIVAQPMTEATKATWRELTSRPAGPNKYCYAVVQAIKQSLILGNTRGAAAEYAGISRATFYEWLKDERKTTFGYEMITEEGADGRPVTRQAPAPVLSFREMVVQAEAAGAHRCITIIARAAAGGAIKSRRTYTQRNGTVVEEIEYALPQYTAATWLLERKYPHEWGPKKREGDLSHLSDEELLALLSENPFDQEAGSRDLDELLHVNGC